jgi:hypothetical protein
MGEMFDIAEARMALQNRRRELVAECEANTKLQRRFDLINAQLRMSTRDGGGQGSAEEVSEPLAASAWEVDPEDGDAEDDSDQTSAPAVPVQRVSAGGGIPRPAASSGDKKKAGSPQSQGGRGAEKRRRYPGVEDLDMENL